MSDGTNRVKSGNHLKLLTDYSVLFEAVQQASGELLKVHCEAGTVFDLSDYFYQHVGRHWQAIISLENLLSLIALE